MLSYIIKIKEDDCNSEEMVIFSGLKQALDPPTERGGAESL